MFNKFLGRHCLQTVSLHYVKHGSNVLSDKNGVAQLSRQLWSEQVVQKSFLQMPVERRIWHRATWVVW